MSATFYCLYILKALNNLLLKHLIIASVYTFSGYQICLSPTVHIKTLWVHHCLTFHPLIVVWDNVAMLTCWLLLNIRRRNCWSLVENLLLRDFDVTFFSILLSLFEISKWYRLLSYLEDLIPTILSRCFISIAFRSLSLATFHLELIWEPAS